MLGLHIHWHKSPNWGYNVPHIQCGAPKTGRGCVIAIDFIIQHRTLCKKDRRSMWDDNMAAMISHNNSSAFSAMTKEEFLNTIVTIGNTIEIKPLEPCATTTLGLFKVVNVERREWKSCQIRLSRELNNPPEFTDQFYGLQLQWGVPMENGSLASGSGTDLMGNNVALANYRGNHNIGFWSHYGNYPPVLGENNHVDIELSKAVKPGYDIDINATLTKQEYLKTVLAEGNVLDVISLETNQSLGLFTILNAERRDWVSSDIIIQPLANNPPEYHKPFYKLVLQWGNPIVNSSIVRGEPTDLMGRNCRDFSRGNHNIFLWDNGNRPPILGEKNAVKVQVTSGTSEPLTG